MPPFRKSGLEHGYLIINAQYGGIATGQMETSFTIIFYSVHTVMKPEQREFDF